MKNIRIIHQDKDYVAIDKPAGLSVHKGIGTEEKTLVDFLVEKFPQIRNIGDDPVIRPGIVHRLDKETSGVIAVARNQRAFEYLKDLFKNRKVEKKYFALVHGKPKTKIGKIEGEIGRSKKDFRKQALARPIKSLSQPGASQKEAFNKVNVRKTRYSLTYYKVLKELDDYSLLEVKPKTGRMHQIRVHLHSIGHPIVGDSKYSFKEFKKKSYPRMFLHANEISFYKENGVKLKFSSPLSKQFESFLTGR